MVRHDFHQFDRRSTLFEHYLDGGGHRFFGNRPNLFSKLDNSTYLGKHFNFTSLCISMILSSVSWKNIPTSVRRHPHQTSSSKGRCPGILLICGNERIVHWGVIMNAIHIWMLLDDVLYMVLSITLSMSFSFVLVCDQPSGLLLEGVLCCHIVFFMTMMVMMMMIFENTLMLFHINRNLSFQRIAF